MLVPNRNFPTNTIANGGYRYGFQGQEKDDDIKNKKGTSLNYKFRMHDPRGGRFLSIDPLATEYPHNSPYAFSENRVIDGTELEGAEYLWYYQNLIKMNSGGSIVLNRKNFSSTFNDQFRTQVRTYVDANGITNLTTNEVVLTPNHFFGFDDTESIKAQYYSKQKNMTQNKNRLITRDLKIGNRTFSYSKISVSRAPVTKTASLGILALIGTSKFIDETYKTFLFNADVTELTNQINTYKTYDAIEDKSTLHISSLDKVRADIKTAQNRNIVPKDIDIQKYSQLFNIILFGGNGDESVEMRKMGNEVLKQVTGDQRKGKPAEYIRLDDQFRNKSKNDEPEP